MSNHTNILFTFYINLLILFDYLLHKYGYELVL